MKYFKIKIRKHLKFVSWYADCSSLSLGELILATGMWPAVSGAIAQEKAVEAVANNLANTDTYGFKRDVPTFQEYLTSVERNNPPLDIPQGPIKDKEFYPLDGKDKSFTTVSGTYTDFTPGHMVVTNQPLDTAIKGPGYFEISTQNGIRYTKQGSFKVATDGQLVTTDGNPVLSAQTGGLAPAQPTSVVQPSQGGQLTQGGVGAEQTIPPEVAARFINISDRGAKITITDEGEVYADRDMVAKLGVAEFQDQRSLRKEAGQKFFNPDPANQVPLGASGKGDTKVLQGMLESSNVNPVREMTDLIQAHRLFEQDLKSVKTYDQMLQKEANDIGRL